MTQPFKDPMADQVAAKAYALKQDKACKLIRGRDWLDMLDAVNEAMEAGWKPVSMIHVPPTMEEQMTQNAVPHPWYTMMIFGDA